MRRIVVTVEGHVVGAVAGGGPRTVAGGSMGGPLPELGGGVGGLAGRGAHYDRVRRRLRKDSTIKDQVRRAAE